MAKKGLSKKQRLFKEEYLRNDFNATKAAIAAGYSEKTARQQGARLLSNVNIKAAIDKAIKEREERLKMDTDEHLKILAKIARTDMKDFLQFGTRKTVVDHDKETGEPIIDYQQIVEMKESSEVDGTLINEVSISKDGTLKFKLHDKKGALELLGRHLGVFKPEAQPPAVTIQNNITTIVQDLTPAERQKAILNASNRLRTQGQGLRPSGPDQGQNHNQDDQGQGNQIREMQEVGAGNVGPGD